MQIINDNQNNIRSYEHSAILRNQKKSISILSWVNLIFLLIIFIVGYFGMNFSSMCNNTNNENGVLNIKNS